MSSEKEAASDLFLN